MIQNLLDHSIAAGKHAGAALYDKGVAFPVPKYPCLLLTCSMPLYLPARHLPSIEALDSNSNRTDYRMLSMTCSSFFTSEAAYALATWLQRLLRV